MPIFSLTVEASWRDDAYLWRKDQDNAKSSRFRWIAVAGRRDSDGRDAHGSTEVEAEGGHLDVKDDGAGDVGNGRTAWKMWMLMMPEEAAVEELSTLESSR